MRIGAENNSQLARQIGDQKDSFGGNNLLVQLEQSVKSALEQKGVLGNVGGTKIDPQEVKNYMAEISPQPLPGMHIQNAVI